MKKINVITISLRAISYEVCVNNSIKLRKINDKVLRLVVGGIEFASTVSHSFYTVSRTFQVSVGKTKSSICNISYGLSQWCRSVSNFL
jgi:hypothetical protein